MLCRCTQATSSYIYRLYGLLFQTIFLRILLLIILHTNYEKQFSFKHPASATKVHKLHSEVWHHYHYSVNVACPCKVNNCHIWHWLPTGKPILNVNVRWEYVSPMANQVAWEFICKPLYVISGPMMAKWKWLIQGGFDLVKIIFRWQVITNVCQHYCMPSRKLSQSPTLLGNICPIDPCFWALSILLDSFI